jgi:pyruvate,water dikinase
VADDLLVVRFDEISAADVRRVGGKNASLGELLRELGSQGIRVPGGFATTARAYWELLSQNGLREKMEALLSRRAAGELSLEKCGKQLRKLICEAELPMELVVAVDRAYADLGAEAHTTDPDVAVRSSATAEDLPEASFAGQPRSSSPSTSWQSIRSRRRVPR